MNIFYLKNTYTVTYIIKRQKRRERSLAEAAHLAAGRIDRFGVGLTRLDILFEHYRLLHFYLVLCLVYYSFYVCLGVQALFSTFALQACRR